MWTVCQLDSNSLLVKHYRSPELETTRLRAELRAWWVIRTWFRRASVGRC
jgi:hypothetical protein